MSSLTFDLVVDGSPVRPLLGGEVSLDWEALGLKVGAGEGLLIARVARAFPFDHLHAPLILVVQETARTVSFLR